MSPRFYDIHPLRFTADSIILMARHIFTIVNFMPHHNLLSESEQMYLVTIRKICESCTDTSIPIPHLAEELSILPVSVNQMVKKLAEAGYVEYIPYKGVELTILGREISTKILRHRRLWEVFLVKDLKMTLDEANSLTCRLEHITTEDVAQRLSTFLGEPTVCFHGSPIYKADGSNLNKEIFLSELKVGQSGHIVQVDADANVKSYLADEGIHSGSEININAINHSGAILLETSNGNQVTVAQNIAEKIVVETNIER